MKKIIAGLCILGFLSLLFACKDSFLEPKPLSYLDGLRVIDPSTYRVPAALASVLRPYQAEIGRAHV